MSETSEVRFNVQYQNINTELRYAKTDRDGEPQFWSVYKYLSSRVMLANPQYIYLLSSSEYIPGLG